MISFSPATHQQTKERDYGEMAMGNGQNKKNSRQTDRVIDWGWFGAHWETNKSEAEIK